MARRSLPNRGYIFEAVWAAAVAARFYKRFGDLKKLQSIRSKKGLAGDYIGRLPPVLYTDVVAILQQMFLKTSHSLETRTQNDVKWNVDIRDYLNVQISVPVDVDRVLMKYAKNRNFVEISDFIRSAAVIANGNSTLNSKVRAVAFNGYTDTINVTADGLLDQRGVKADVKVTISTQDPNIQDIRPFVVSCKVPGGEQFAQVSGYEWQKFEDLFGQIGITIPQTVHQEWLESMQEYLTEGIFARRYSTRQAIVATRIPKNTKLAAKRVYRSAANVMNSNFPVQNFVDYIIRGFSNGVETELVKLTGRKISGDLVMTGGKTLRVDQQFRESLMQLNYTAEYKDTGEGAKILIKAEGIADSLMQFRYKWENKSNKPSSDTPQKTYSMYPRHYLEALDGMFDIDSRTQKFTISQS